MPRFCASLTQFSTSANETFSNLLDRVIARQKSRCSDQESSPEYWDTRFLTVFVHYSEKVSMAPGTTVSASLADTCEAMQASKFSYIQFRIIGPPIEQDSVIVTPLNSSLMKAQKQLLRPRKFAPKHALATLLFPAGLYNFIVDNYATSGLGVRPGGSLEYLEKLTKATRDVIQLLHGKVPESKLPSRFRNHGLERFNNRDRTRNTQPAFQDVTSNLERALSECSGFLSTQMWKTFKSDVIGLRGLMLEELDSLKAQSLAKAARQSVTKSDLSLRLTNKKTIEAVAEGGTPPCYSQLVETLEKMEQDEYLVIQPSDIDLCLPTDNTAEKSAAARMPRQRF